MTTGERIAAAAGLFTILSAIVWVIFQAGQAAESMRQMEQTIQRIELRQELLQNDFTGHELQSTAWMARNERGD